MGRAYLFPRPLRCLNTVIKKQKSKLASDKNDTDKLLNYRTFLFDEVSLSDYAIANFLFAPARNPEVHFVVD